MIHINLTLNDGITVLKKEGVISICSELCLYHKIGGVEEFIYHTLDFIDGAWTKATETQKLEFEIRVREIIRELERLEGRL